MSRRAYELGIVFGIFGQVGHVIPPPASLGVESFGRGCQLEPNIRQMRIAHADAVFELGMQRVAAQGDIRERSACVPRPTHVSHCAPAAAARGTARPARRPVELFGGALVTFHGRGYI